MKNRKFSKAIRDVLGANFQQYSSIKRPGMAKKWSKSVAGIHRVKFALSAISQVVKNY